MQLVCTALIPEPFASLMFYTASNTTSEQFHFTSYITADTKINKYFKLLALFHIVHIMCDKMQTLYLYPAGKNKEVTPLLRTTLIWTTKRKTTKLEKSSFFFQIIQLGLVYSSDNIWFTEPTSWQAIPFKYNCKLTISVVLIILYFSIFNIISLHIAYHRHISCFWS